MLIHLNISNFAIIRELEIDFDAGLNILSGETGAGKSIIINAVNLLLGARASSDLIRSGCNEARVEALFEIPENPALSALLSELGAPFSGEILIKRTIYREGRNKISVNGSIVTLHMLSQLATILISISGQHEHHFLLKSDNHLSLLDDFAMLSDRRLSLSEAFAEYQSLKQRARTTGKEIEAISDKRELNAFQIREIEEAGLRPGEDVLLDKERQRLEHAEELLTIVSEGYRELYENKDSLVSTISRALRSLTKGVEIDDGLLGPKEILEDCEIRLEDAAFTLRDFQKNIDLDPARLQEIRERTELLNALKRKYGPTLEDVLSHAEALKSAMDELDEKSRTLRTLEEQLGTIEKQLLLQAAALSEERRSAAQSLEKSVKKELGHLHMGQTEFKVDFSPGPGEREISIEDVDADGVDRIEFLISPNSGEDLRPLARIASGGELSRIMLAIRTILSKRSAVETVIFDEVDSGISGATAEVVGEKLRSLAGYHQILCITHLPQIASQGQSHYLVKKDVIDSRTEASISRLDRASRIHEIARLLGGREITQSAISHARELLEQKLS